MRVIAAQFTGLGAESVDDMIDGADHHVEKAPLSGRLEIGYGPLQQVAHGIHLVQVAQVRPALLRFAANEPAVEIAVGHLALFEFFDDRFDLRLDLDIGMSLERVAGGFDPLAEVGIEKCCIDRPLGWIGRARGPGGFPKSRTSRNPSSSRQSCWDGMVTLRTVSVQLCQKPPLNSTRLWSAGTKRAGRPSGSDAVVLSETDMETPGGEAANFT